VVRLQVAGRVRVLQRLLRLDATDGGTVAGVELAPVKLAAIFRNPRRPSLERQDASRDVEVSPTACQRVTIPVEVDIDLGHRSTSTVLTLIVEAFSLPLPERLLLLANELGVPVQTHCPRRMGLLKEALLGVEGG
jgi:hypothetical protein